MAALVSKSPLSAAAMAELMREVWPDSTVSVLDRRRVVRDGSTYVGTKGEGEFKMTGKSGETVWNLRIIEDGKIVTRTVRKDYTPIFEDSRRAGVLTRHYIQQSDKCAAEEYEGGRIVKRRIYPELESSHTDYFFAYKNDKSYVEKISRTVYGKHHLQNDKTFDESGRLTSEFNYYTHKRTAEQLQHGLCGYYGEDLSRVAIYDMGRLVRETISIVGATGMHPVSVIEPK